MDDASSRETAEIRAKTSDSLIDAPSVTFESLTFSDGTTISLDPRDVVVFVGPNNAGKSAALREISAQFAGLDNPKIVKSASRIKKGDAQQIEQLLDSYSHLSFGDNYKQYKGYKYTVHVASTRPISLLWQRELSVFRSVFCLMIPTESRITDSNPADAIYTLNDPPSHPIHIIFKHDLIENRISGYFKRAFGQELIVFRGGGTKWPLLVGARPERKPYEDSTSESFVKKLLSSTVTLQDQGDGMRSFASVILHLLAPSTPSILILDEPEAFLHPPQARLLGEIIATERSPRAQLFVATHSPDVLQGLLNVAPEHLRVLRIQREGNINRVRELDKSKAKQISNDPLMKYSSVLSGVFHKRVIVCEADADCMFYSSLLDLPQVHGGQHPDVLFVHANGKHRMATLVEALTALDVRVDVIADIDLLREADTMGRIIEALGGDWKALQPKSLTRKDAHGFKPLRVVWRAREYGRRRPMRRRWRWSLRNPWQGAGSGRAMRTCARRPSGGARPRSPLLCRSA